MDGELREPRIGLAVREENLHLLGLPPIAAAEITFERADDPLRLRPMFDRDHVDYLSLHCLKLSVASPDAPPEEYLKQVESAARQWEVDAISDHLGFTRGRSGVEIGHFAPPPYTVPALDATCRNIELLQSRFAPTPFFLENITYQFQFDGTMEETEFLSEVLRRTGCGWLLDVTNVYANAVNFQFDPYEFIGAVMPHAPALQMHLSGGFFHPQTGLYVDSHSRPIPDAVWDLFDFSVEIAGPKLKAVFIERDQSYPEDLEWLSEIERAQQLCHQASAV